MPYTKEVLLEGALVGRHARITQAELARETPRGATRTEAREEEA
jgi:hypothetical protein